VAGAFDVTQNLGMPGMPAQEPSPRRCERPAVALGTSSRPGDGQLSFALVARHTCSIPEIGKNHNAVPIVSDVKAVMRSARAARTTYISIDNWWSTCAIP
jgi:hypothetical protein